MSENKFHQLIGMIDVVKLELDRLKVKVCDTENELTERDIGFVYDALQDSLMEIRGSQLLIG